MKNSDFFMIIATMIILAGEGIPAAAVLFESESKLKRLLIPIILGMQVITVILPSFIDGIIIGMIISCIILAVLFFIVLFLDDNKLNKLKEINFSKGLLWGVIGILAFVFATAILYSSAVLVQPGQRAVKTSWGKVQNKTYQPGLVWKVPCSENLGNKVITVETRPQRYGYNVPVRTKDMQKVSLDCSVLLEINPDSVHVMYDKYQGYPEYEERVIKDLVNSVVLTISSRMDFWSFAGNETEMMTEAVEYIVRDQLMSENLVKVSSFRVLKYTPSKEVEDLIEEIVKTKKGIELEEYKVKMARIATERVREEALQEYERIAAVAKANGIDVQIKAESLRNPFVAQYELAKAIQNWNGQLTFPNTLMLGGNNGLFPIVMR